MQYSFNRALSLAGLLRLEALLCALLVAVCLSGCERAPAEAAIDSRSSSNDNAGSTSAVAVTDYWGRSVSLPAPAKRIVALSPHIVENLYSAGLGDAIVATVSYADYPEAAKQIPRIGGFTNFSVESIVAWQPDLVIGWASGYQGFGRLLEQLGQLGIAVYADDPKSHDDIARSIADFASLGASEADWRGSVAQFSGQLAQLRRQYSAQASAIERPVRVFYEIWHQPLQTLNGEHMVSAAIELCGGENIFAAAPVLAPTINIESVLAANPELIVASSSDNTRPVWLDQWQDWPSLQAVQRQQIYFIPGDLLSRHSLRIADGTAMLCGFIDRARAARPQPVAFDRSK